MEQELLMEADLALAKEAADYLKYCGMKTISLQEKAEDMACVYCDKKEFREASKQIAGFEKAKQQKEEEDRLADMTAEEIEQMEEEARKEAMPHIYQNCKDKAEDHRSSAVSFLIIGTLGLILVILSWFQVLPFCIGGAGNWFTHGILFIFFAAFIAVGVVSACNVNKYKDLACEEETQQQMVEQFLKETFSQAVLSEIVAETEEETYFKRMNEMRERVQEVFPDIAKNEAFAETLLDAHYDAIFG